MEIEKDTIGGLSRSQYRRALGRLPMSAVVVGAMVDTKPVGMIIGTFTSVSVKPSLVGFFGDQTSPTLSALLSAPVLSFSVLDQSDLAVVSVFRGPRNQRYESLDWSVSKSGTPHLASSILTIDAIPFSIADAGDHRSIVAEVVEVTVGDPIARPLVFQAGRVAHLDPGQMLDRELWQLGWGV